MTETAIPQATPTPRPTDKNMSKSGPVTPLATLLAQAAAPPELTAYCGTMTPRELDTPERETAALAFGAAVHDLGWLRRVAVRGEDSFRWLNGMVTNTVNDLAVNAGAWNLVLDAKGHIQGDLYVWREGDKSPQQHGPVAGDPELSLTIALDQYDRLLAHLGRFIIMDDVELTPLSRSAAGEFTGEAALGLTGPLAVDVLKRLGLPALDTPLTSACAVWNGMNVRVVRAYGVLAPHYEVWVSAAEIPALWRAIAEAGATPAGAVALDAFRIAEGIPAYGIDIAERDLPQETSQMRALSFNKGCYLGQEIVERIHSRGSVRQRLRRLELSGPVPAAGAELVLDGSAVAGRITSAAELPLPSHRIFALGMIREDSELRNQPFTYTAGTATGTARILAVPPDLDASQRS